MVITTPPPIILQVVTVDSPPGCAGFILPDLLWEFYPVQYQNSSPVKRILSMVITTPPTIILQVVTVDSP
jgi:hypothetical protein